MIAYKDSERDSAADSMTLVSEAVGDIFERIGMRSLLGRIWSILYLSKDPMDVHQIQHAANVSSGALSMGLNELLELGLVHRDTRKGERRFYYRAETEMWPLVTRIFRDRERARLANPIEKIREAEKHLRQKEKSATDEEAYCLEQVRHLVGLGSFVIDLLDAFMERTKVEVKAAQKWLSVSGKLGGEPLSRLRRRINAARPPLSEKRKDS